MKSGEREGQAIASPWSIHWTGNWLFRWFIFLGKSLSMSLWCLVLQMFLIPKKR